MDDYESVKMMSVLGGNVGVDMKGTAILGGIWKCTLIQ